MHKRHEEYEAPLSFFVTEWNTPLDVDKANKEYIERSEELWGAIEKARWSFWSELSLEEN